MRRNRLAAAASAAVMVMSAGVASAHPGESDGGDQGHGGGSDGHIPAGVNYGFEPVGHSALTGVQDGRYTDVWAHEGYAYVGSFQDPDCSRAGVYITDISDPTDPTYVGDIASPPNTRVNDVKVTDVGDRDVLIFSLEKCGALLPNGQQGQGGIALWDVTDPTKPVSLKQNFLKFQVHNTYPWTDKGRTYALVVDDENLNDLHVVDLTKPQSPKLIASTGLGDWLEAGTFNELTSELSLGVFGASLLHDVWVEYNPTAERWEGVLSYWDAGFITVDLSEPDDPTFIADSDYPSVDPVHDITPPEGNAHAAVFGGDDNEFIFAGDEDFDPFRTVAQYEGSDPVLLTQGDDVPQVGSDIAEVSGSVAYVGRACTPIEDDLSSTSTGAAIALVERGDCAFTTKAVSAEDAGYDAVIIFNQPSSERGGTGGCEATVSMIVAAGIPAMFAPRSGGYELLGLAYDPATDCEDADSQALLTVGAISPATVTITAPFDGWGYFWGLNNSGVDMTVPAMSMGTTPTIDVEPMGTIGYYAPAEVADEALASGAGDLTMHNLETDIDASDAKARERTFISWYALGMRAVEWRPGHFHTNANGEGVYSWNFHEVGRWIAGADDPFVIEAADAAGVDPETMAGSDFWGVTQTVIDGTRYVLGSDRNTGLWIFEWSCEDATATLYCNRPVEP